MNPYNKSYVTPDGLFSPGYGPIEHLHLDPLLRQWLLSLIASSGLESSYFIKYHLELKLTSCAHALLIGSCPWCGGEESFSFSKKTLFAQCSICLRKDDLLGLIAEKKQYKDLYLSFYELKSFMEFPPPGLLWLQVQRGEKKGKRAKGGAL